MQGKFIVIEGLEGAGKTTAIKTVEALLKQRHISDLVFTREPGGTPIAEALREIIKQGIEGDPLTSKAELLLFYAARIQLIENVIKPALHTGKWVIGDRHDLSTQAYQGGGRQLNTAWMNQLRTSVLEGFKPDLTLYMDIEPSIGLARAKARGKLDRIEQESLAFFTRIRNRYLELASQDPTIITIDASQDLPNVTKSITEALTNWLNQHDIH